jgi:steroid delta-isomerase-like uncharacterized protein
MEPVVTVTENMTRLLEDFARVWDAGSPPGMMDQIFSPDVVDHSPQPGQADGRAGMQQILDLYHAVFPDLRVTTEDVLVSGDRAALRWTATGTHEGDQLGVPATHRTVRLTGIDIVRVEDGRIVEHWGESNALEVMQQLS